MSNDKVKVYINNKQNIIKLQTGIRMLIRRCCIAVLRHENFKGNAEVNVNFVDNKEIRLINNEFRNKNIETDVLSFPLGENGIYDINPDTKSYMLGDIVISFEKAIHQSKLYKHSLQRELAFLTVHAMLHLLGYDHEISHIESIKMREKEEEILKKIGLPRIVV